MVRMRTESASRLSVTDWGSLLGRTLDVRRPQLDLLSLAFHPVGGYGLRQGGAWRVCHPLSRG